MNRNKLIVFFALLSFTSFAFAGSSLSSIITLGVAIGGMLVGVPPIWLMAATFATSIITSRIFAPNQNQSVNFESVGSTNSRQQIPPDTTTPIPMAYGITYLGGKFVDAALRTDQKVMYYCMAISCKSEDSVVVADTTSMYYGDRKITFDITNPTKVVSLTDSAGNVDTSIDNFLFINIYVSDKDGNVVKLNGTKYPWEYESDGGGGGPGTSLQWADRSELIESQQWASTGRRMNGLIWATIRLGYSTTAQTTSLSPITFRIGQFLKDTATTKPGDVWVDYMTNTVYGAAVPIEFIDTASATALNNYSDELITYNDYDGNPQTQPRYRINGVIDPSQGCLQNVDQIMTACDSWQKYDATTGKWSVVINKASDSSYSFNDSNLIGSIVVGSIDIAQMPNQIEAKFPDSTNRDQYNYVNESVPSGLLLPNEPVNKVNLNYDLVNNSVQALYLANRVLEQSREDLLVTITTTYDGIQVNAGDVIDLTNSYYGWTNKLFRAMQVKESITQDGLLSAQIQLIEYNAAVYDNATINQYAPSPNGNLDNPGYFSALSPPTEVNIYPYVSVPSFDINIAIPVTGRVSYIILYYTTVASPTALDWNVLDTQKLSDGQVYAGGTTITFPHYTIPANTYYFAYLVGNGIAQSPLSPLSSAFVWTPDPANASSFTLTFNPATLQVPYSGGTPTFADVTCKLYGQNGLGGVDFVTSQTDSDSAFIVGTWRIGNSSTTGYADIVETNITVPTPTDGGTHADFGIPTAMPSSPATMLVPVRYKDLAGIVHQVSPATIQYAYQTAGTSANKYATGYLYQWNTTTPSNPSGTSIYSWATGGMSSYTGGGGWTTTIPSNPGTSLIQLWRASTQITDVSTASTTSVSWSSGYSVANVTQNGANGTQAATPTVFQWAVTIPSSPTGTSTYTWATTSFTPTPSGWSLTPGTSPSSGYTLWGASVQLVDSALVTTSSINWTTASITARGYSGEAGASSRICYASTTSSSLSPTPTTYTTSGSSSFPPYNTWGGSETWVATPPSITAGQSVYQSDGIYSPSTGNTVWNVPYLSNLKVGSLSAITVNTGNLTVTGTIQAGSAALSGTTMTGSGLVVYNGGNYALGDSAGNITYNGAQTTINGDLVATGNVKLYAITVPTIATGSVYTGLTTSYITLLAFYVTIDVAGYIYVSSTQNIGYPSGNCGTEHRIIIDGDIITYAWTGDSLTTVVAMSGAYYYPAGTYFVQLQSQVTSGIGSGSAAVQFVRTLYAQGIKR